MYLTVDTLSAAVESDPNVAHAMSFLQTGLYKKDVFRDYIKEGTTDEIDSDLLLSDLLNKITSEDPAEHTIYKSYYELLLKKHFSDEHKFKTLAEVRIPRDLNMGDVAIKLDNISDNMTARTRDHLELLDDPEKRSNPNIGNVFANVVDGEIQVDESAIAQHLEFIEMARKINLQEVYDNPNKVAIKILSYYLETHKSLSGPKQRITD